MPNKLYQLLSLFDTTYKQLNNKSERNMFQKMILFALLLSVCFSVEPTWGVYPTNIMYSGQYKAFTTVAGSPKTPGTFMSISQRIYRVDVVPAGYYTAAPKVVLSLLGYQQSSPSNVNTYVGFDVRITAIRATQFDVQYTVFGASMSYLNYMYLTVSSANTDYIIGFYTQTFDINASNKTYTVNIPLTAPQSYPNYLTNKIQMKGFLSGFKISQGAANGMYLNFSMRTKDASSFTIQVSVNGNSFLQKISFFRIGYDRTAIQRANYNNVFRDFGFELVNNVTTASIYTAGFATQIQFQYRNFLMGTNKINIQSIGTTPFSVEFYLQYYFAESFSKVDYSPPVLYVDNPAKANYLYGETFYHVTKACSATGTIYYLPTDRKCYTNCPVNGFFQDTASKTCLACHYSCLTCSQPYISTSCLTCDTFYRSLNAGTSRCQCPVRKFDDGVNVACASCHSTCLTCDSTTSTTCKSCSSFQNRYFSDPNSDGIGTCLCSSAFFQNPSLVCTGCSAGCLTCTSSTICLSCDVTYRTFNSSNSKCQCPLRKYDDGINAECASCHSSCLSCTSGSLSACKSCSSSQFRYFQDTNSDGLGVCLCSLSYYQNPSVICTSCSAGCLTCTVSGGVQTCSNCNTIANFQLVSTQCTCQTGYILSSGQCVIQVCGNGIKTVSEQCDDNNILNGDGCSNQCKVEINHNCFEDVSVSPYSICYFNGSLTMTITEVTKSPYANQVKLGIRIEASQVNQEFLTGYLTNSPSIILQDTSRRMLMGQKGRILTSTALIITGIYFDVSSRMLYVTFSYSQSFDITTKKIRFQPSSSAANSDKKYFFNSPEAIVRLEQTHNKIDTTYFDLSQYSKAISFKTAFLGIIIAFWIGSMLFIVIGKGNIAMEMMIVLQIAYASLLSQSNIQITFGGLSEFGKYTSGYNIELVAQAKSCVNFISIYLSCSLIQNLNISILVIILAILIFFGFKMCDKYLNHRAEQQFIDKQNLNNLKNQRTDENINPHQNQRNDRVSESEQSQALQLKYYKNQEFVPKKVFSILMDFIYFMAFVTVMIWGLSLCFIKQQTVPNIIAATFIGILYFGLWIFWFLRYFSSDFSFVQAHKKTQATYKQESQKNSQIEEQNGGPQRQIAPKKAKLPLKLLKVFFYPLVWVCLLCTSLILALTQSVGYVAQAVIISGCIFFSLVIWFTQIYKQKINTIRSILNCVLICLVQIVYIVSQTDSVVGTGVPIMVSIYVLLCLAFISNTVSTFYLFYIERRLSKKQQGSNKLQQIQKQINRLQEIKRQNENMGLFVKKTDEQSLSFSRSIPFQNQRTIKKPAYYSNNQNLHQESAHSTEQKNQEKSKLTKDEIKRILNQDKVKNSESYIAQMRKTQIKQDNKGKDMRFESESKLRRDMQSQDHYARTKKGIFTTGDKLFYPMRDRQAPSISNILVDQNQIRIDPQQYRL